ncbi:alkylphosphonate utilization protein [Mesorhizobium sp. M7A.F.Ca.US.008.03.1.1]|nr:alkylphosphonate utilization protein [Mesorhizobium sp. M7A.F.Ca.US.008.03.1.1]
MADRHLYGLLESGQGRVIRALSQIRFGARIRQQAPLVKAIRLNGNPGEIECNTKQVKGLVLKTEFVKKA